MKIVMTQSPPPGPRPPRNGILGFDEGVALVVAFLGIGTILVWGMSRTADRFNLAEPLFQFRDQPAESSGARQTGDRSFNPLLQPNSTVEPEARN